MQLLVYKVTVYIVYDCRNVSSVSFFAIPHI